MVGSDGRIWIFIATPSQHPLMNVPKHTRQCLENHDRAKSRPKYPDGFANEFEMRLRIDGLLFPIGKICRRMTHFGQPLGTAQRPSHVPSHDLPNTHASLANHSCVVPHDEQSVRLKNTGVA
jgi:hypothetical protein